jgi:hypothetical protein
VAAGALALAAGIVVGPMVALAPSALAQSGPPDPSANIPMNPPFAEACLTEPTSRACEQPSLEALDNARATQREKKVKKKKYEKKRKKEKKSRKDLV